MTTKIGIVILLFFIMASCRSKKENVFIWDKEEDHRQLTLLDDHTFVFQIDAGYYTRMDTGVYELRGDTILLNPDKAPVDIDSVVSIETLYNGHRFIEVLIEEVTFGNNEIIDSDYRPQLFPSVIINENESLQLDPDDPGFQKLILPDSIQPKSVMVTLVEENTCKPKRQLSAPIDKSETDKSYQIYISSPLRKVNYLAKHKWLIKGNTVYSSFADDQCTPAAVKLVRKK